MEPLKTKDVEKSCGQIRRSHKLALLSSGVLGIYILTYSILSLGGDYEPSMVGTFGVEQYLWAPIGFYNHKHQAGNLGWNNAMCYTFLPLWWLDNSYVHSKHDGSR
jgi:hypothetical protein